MAAAMMEQPLQPELVKSVTEDDDNSSAASGSDKALEYLLRYETMVRQQDAEDMATLAHLRPLLYRIEKLGGKKSKETPQDMEDIMSREVSFTQLQQALVALDNDSSQVMTTDRQLMLVLRTLAKKSPETDDECISWAEFYQCYKTVVAGMQTLQYVPSQSLVRSRTKDRTLTLLTLFEPPSTKLFNEDVPRTIHTGEDEALESDRHYMMPELRRKRKKAMSIVILMAVAAMLFCLLVKSPHINNGKPIVEIDNVIFQLNEAVQAAKTSVAPWLPEHMVTGKTSPRQEEHSFFQHFHMSALEEEPVMNDPKTTSHRDTVEKDDANAVVAVLAGAGGVAVAPLVVKVAALLQTGGLPGMGAVTLFTVAIAPVMKGIDVMIGRVLRALHIGKKK